MRDTLLGGVLLIAFIAMATVLMVALTPSAEAQIIITDVPGERVVATVTAYSEIDSCHYENCAMASGNRAYIGAVACPRSVAIYSMIVIDGVEYQCEDRTANKLDGRYDIFMGYGKESHQQAIVYGIQKKVVTIQRP